MQPIYYRAPSEKEYKQRYVDEYDSYEDFLEQDRRIHDERASKAQGIYLAYVQLLTPLTGNREAIALIREQMRADEDFWQASAMIAEMSGTDPNWIPAIMRAESKRAERSASENFEKIRAEKAAARAAEKAAELAELESMPNFGMF